VAFRKSHKGVQGGLHSRAQGKHRCRYDDLPRKHPWVRPGCDGPTKPLGRRKRLRPRYWAWGWRSIECPRRAIWHQPAIYEYGRIEKRHRRFQWARVLRRRVVWNQNRKSARGSVCWSSPRRRGQRRWWRRCRVDRKEVLMLQAPYADPNPEESHRRFSYDQERTWLARQLPSRSVWESQPSSRGR